MAGNLPEEMITQILIRVPVKSLLQCKSVCKPWLYTISNPHFIKSQLHHAVKASQYKPTLLDLLDPLPKLFPDIVNEDFLFFYEENYQLRLQLIFEALLDTNKHGFSLNKGFWYDSIADDYKVFRIMFVVSSGYILPPTVQVYSSNADSWTEFEPPNNMNDWADYYASRSSIAINGILYISTDNNLFSFDLKKEAFVLVPFPGLYQEKRSKIMEFQGCAAMVFESESGVALWTLDDVSAHNAWTKRFGIEVDSEWNMQLYCYLGAGQFYGKILINQNDLYGILYDYEKRETKYYLPGEDNILATLKYTETLVSLDGFLHVE
ncbi:hypothetical protein POM88_008736 [Heracleum sosnowskyi]|uniref:F-box domain-containing protein n=1 Tax=Heracleum sosnowskyi TaxID=360622 RepID=A0AAD8J7S6_9APIA|nr:hypothetical protein POM88_008736 [Heracleum sosnowskyi]